MPGVTSQSNMNGYRDSTRYGDYNNRGDYNDYRGTYGGKYVQFHISIFLVYFIFDISKGP